MFGAYSTWSLWLWIVGLFITIGTILFAAGTLKGAIMTRLDNIERRITELEVALGRCGFTFRRTRQKT